MRATRWLVLFSSLVFLNTTPATADMVSVDLGLTTPDASRNTLSVAVTIDVGIMSRSDSDETAATGNFLSDLTATFDPQTHEVVSVDGIELTGGDVAFSELAFNLDFGLFVGAVNASGTGIHSTFDTPNPPGSVVGDVFQTIEHTMIMNQGIFHAVGTGLILGTMEPIEIDLADVPIEATTDAEGTLQVSLSSVEGDVATYDVLVRLPVQFDEVAMSDDTATVIVSGEGTFEAVGQFSRSTISVDLHPGDADLNGATDLSDFNIWNANKFVSGTQWTTGDFNGDDTTDLSDFNIWNAHKFTTAGGGAAPAPVPVPEPGTWALLICTAVALLPWRRPKVAGR